MNQWTDKTYEKLLKSGKADPAHLLEASAAFSPQFLVETAYLNWYQAIGDKDIEISNINIATQWAHGYFIAEITHHKFTHSKLNFLYYFNRPKTKYGLIISYDKDPVYMRDLDHNPSTSWYINKLANNKKIINKHGEPIFKGCPYGQ